MDDDIELSGSAVDLQDGVIPDQHMVWSSNISGKLGTGGDIVTTLPPGEHIITLTATNSAGLTSSSSVVIRVGSLAVDYSEDPATESITAASNFLGLLTSAKLPAGALNLPAAVIIEVTAAPANPIPPAGLTFAGRSFDLDVEQETSPDDFTPVTMIPQGVNITLKYGGPFDPNSLKLFRWDAASHSWIDAATECQPASTYSRIPGRITTTVCKTGHFALAGAMLTQGLLLPTNVRVGPGQLMEFPVRLLAPAGPNGLIVAVRTSDPSKVLLSPGAELPPLTCSSLRARQRHGVDCSSPVLTSGGRNHGVGLWGSRAGDADGAGSRFDRVRIAGGLPLPSAGWFESRDSYLVHAGTRGWSGCGSEIR